MCIRDRPYKVELPKLDCKGKDKPEVFKHPEGPAHKAIDVYKRQDVLNPAGILMVIVPCSFMQSGFWEKTRIAGINGRFSFVAVSYTHLDVYKRQDNN